MNVLSIGEVLWDCFPEKEILGGAPLNFAVDLHRLGDRGIVISAVGNDRCGEMALQTIRETGLSIDFVPMIKDISTGVAIVEVGPNGEPKFRIPRPVAFDCIALSEKSFSRIRDLEIDWLYFGTLAQIDTKVEELTANLSRNLPRVRCFYDMNLREDNWNLDLVKRLCRLATVLKLNEAEAKIMSDLSSQTTKAFSLEGFCSAWAAEHDLDVICITLGANGCCIYEKGEVTTCAGHAVQVVNTVGSGDAFSAGFLYGYHRGWPNTKTARFANAMGALVAGHAGAMPRLTLEQCNAMAFGNSPA